MAKIMIVDDDQKMIDLFRSRLAGSHEITETTPVPTGLNPGVSRDSHRWKIVLSLSFATETGLDYEL
jgi:hypothetical protein